ncbi:phthioceranic/hydroxyphthioceranic acid synthase [Eucyclogobius newberryi]|uniref:phthioceranic/hydroxyphthioceranic acid synthase n=1 Tax=Eucyclogobius newberryi TaxID=166745 RepID=UPI003B58F692
MEMNEEDIAVVGIGCNFPGGEGLDNFWKVLVEGRNCALPIPRERFDMGIWYDADDNKAGKSRTAKAALIEGFNEFDHRLFGISDSEVEQMDPQQKQLLQCVFRALENAGLPLEKASGTRTGVFFGLMNRDYETNAAHVHPSVINHWTGTGLAMSVAANRVSYVFNFTGPSMSIDSACSSSLVALHLACQAIKQGDCDMAVCGGVNAIIEPRVFVALSKAKMISPDGTSKPFSNKADGYGRGEGCGVVLLKPLKKALEDHDHIWGIISKTAVNQDGHSVSPITKPSISQQEELLRYIYRDTNLINVQYIEAHGTGTPIGDPTEAGSISNAIAKSRTRNTETLRIGSVKSNIGHTESAAGVAGLIKVLLMMKHKTIVPSVFYSEETASVDAKALNIKVPKEAEKWEPNGDRVAGINNFGFGGTNAHAIVKQYKQKFITPKDNPVKNQLKYFVLTASSQKSLTLMMEDTIKQLDADTQIDLDSLLYTSACRRSHQKHKYRIAVMVSNVAELKEKLSANISKNVRPSLLESRLVFVFCGNGVTYHGMCKQLLACEPVFRQKITEITQLFQRLSPLNILETLENDIESCDFNKPDLVQPLLFAIQVSLDALFRHWGIKPDAILGHSVGEVAAAHCSGLLSLEDAVKVIYYRSYLQSKVAGGKMLVVSNMAVSDLTPILSRYSGKISLAAANSPHSCTLSGDANAIEAIYNELNTSDTSQKLFLRVLDVSAAYHSHMMDPILDAIKEKIGFLNINTLEIELFSTVTGKEFQDGDFCSGNYWARNIREPVAFEQAVRSASKGKRNTVFLEIGPRRALQRNIMETLGNDTAVLASAQPGKDHETAVSVVPKLFELGIQVDWDTFYKGYETLPLDFPKYQFDTSDRDVIIGAAQENAPSNHPVLCKKGSESNVFSSNLTSEFLFYLKEHQHNDIPIIPGAFYAELGLAAFMASAKPKVPLKSLQLSVNFHSPFVFLPNSPEMKVQLVQTEKGTSFTVFSQSAMYASGTVVSSKEKLIEEQRISLKSIRQRCTSVVDYQELYGYLLAGGFKYGDVFQNKSNVHYGEDLKEAFSTVTVPEALRPQLHEYCIHPVVLDYLMQLLPVTVEHIFAGRPGFPAKIGSLTVFEPLEDEMVVYLRAIDIGLDHFEVCGCFADKEGKVLVEVKNVIIKYLGSRSHVVEEYFYHNAFNVISESIPSVHPPRALVFCDSVGISKGLQQHLHSESCYVSFTHAEHILAHGFSSLLDDLKLKNKMVHFDEVLYLWGMDNLTSLEPDAVMQNLADYCEIFRQIVLGFKKVNFPNSIRAVTYHASEITVDHINTGFAISGMTRSLSAEIPNLSFQLIDLNSVSAEDIAALSQILRSFPCSKHPELVVRDGLVMKPSIVRTPPQISDSSEAMFSSSMSEHCIFQTSDAHKITNVSAIHTLNEAQLNDTSVEIRPNNICVHSSDYFPVSLSHLKYGQTLYWNQHSIQKHKVIALDFSGTITAVGGSVKKLKVGDHVACCFPVPAGSKVIVAKDLCYSTKDFPFLQKTPCISFFVLAWEILHKVLPNTKHHIGIICSVADSVLIKVLSLALKQSGHCVVVGTQYNGSFVDVKKFDAFIILPPFHESLIAKIHSFPNVQRVVIICESQYLPAPHELQSLNDRVHVQTLQMPAILQKGSMTTQRPKILKWLKSLIFCKKFTIDSFTFQSPKSETIHVDGSEKTQSYFNTTKIGIIELTKGSQIPLLPPKNKLFRNRAVYIVAGGLSGLGYETVKFISQRGGGNVVILSRRKPSPEVQQDLNNIKKQCGNCIISLECDISVSEHMQRMVLSIGQKFPDCPIRGVFHSAVVLQDGLIETLNRSLYEKVFKPKVNGVLNLHNATKHCQLDYFVCYSSISAFLGNASQTNYAAANTFLDLFCQYRRKLGLPGQSINWGALNLGLLLNQEHFQKFLEAKGMMVLEMSEIYKSLEQCLILNQPQQAVCRFHFRNIRYNILSQNAALTMRLSALVEEAFQKNKEIEAEGKQADSIPPKEFVVSLLSETIGVDKSELKDESLLSSLGIDSMQAMTLQNVIFQQRGLNVPLVKLLDPNSTLSTVVSILSEGNEGELLESVPTLQTDDLLTRL